MTEERKCPDCLNPFEGRDPLLFCRQHGPAPLTKEQSKKFMQALIRGAEVIPFIQPEEQGEEDEQDSFQYT